MNIIETNFPGLIILEPTVLADSRGYFFESFNQKHFDAKGLMYGWVQENESMSNKGVVRGLHYQLAPFSQTKLVRVVAGAVVDAVVDVRKGSPTFGQKFEILLSAENKKQLLIPKGFAHGFSVLEDHSIFSYKCDAFYNKESERGINPFDTLLNIDWQMAQENAIVSEKDLASPTFDTADLNFQYF